MSGVSAGDRATEERYHAPLTSHPHVLHEPLPAQPAPASHASLGHVTAPRHDIAPAHFTSHAQAS